MVLLSSTAEASGSLEHHEVTIDWSRFADAENLNSVGIEVTSVGDSSSERGTSVRVIGLLNPAYWEGRGELDLQKQLASILSPYENAAGLRVFIRVNDAEVDTRREAKRLLDIAPNLIRFRYADGKLFMEAESQISVLRGQSNDQASTYERLIAGDNGFAFAGWLLAERDAKSKSVGAQHGDDKYFMRFARTLTFAESVDPSRGSGDPGPFSGEISSFNYDSREGSALDSKSELREFARTLSGIRVFRDGFGIRLDEDWLGLARQQTQATSFYGLRPLNTAGFVNLSARGNAALEETSSREAFRDTPAWRGFHDLMQQVVKFARDTQELLRRNWLVYAREHETPTVIPESSTPAEISAHIEERAAQAAAAKRRADDAAVAIARLDNVVANLRESSGDSATAIWQDEKLQAAVQRAANEIQDAQGRLGTALAEVQAVLGLVQDLRGAAALLREKVDTAEERVGEAWESVALGLSAEILAHEVDQISDRLRGRSHQILDYLRKQEPVDARTIAYAEHVRASSAELTRQVARLNPSLRFRRDTKAKHRVSDMVRDAVEFHSPRLAAAGVVLRIEISKDFEVRMNEGKFMQVIDNLVRNSEYWVERDMKQRGESQGEVVVTVDSPRVIVSDSGPGVSASAEDSLFEPFVSMKPRAEGRGLGLFVVAQLLDSEGAKIDLSQERNNRGRRATFEVDLRAAMTLSDGDS